VLKTPASLPSVRGEITRQIRQEKTICGTVALASMLHYPCQLTLTQAEHSHSMAFTLIACQRTCGDVHAQDTAHSGWSKGCCGSPDTATGNGLEHL
jgi:hypothetical protein